MQRSIHLVRRRNRRLRLSRKLIIALSVFVLLVIGGSLFITAASDPETGRQLAAEGSIRQGAGGSRPSTSQDEVWRDADEQLVKRIVIDRQAAPKSYRVLTLNHTTLTAVLNKAPLEFSEESKKAIQLTTGISSMRNTIARL
jgi:hypothetical protein